MEHEHTASAAPTPQHTPTPYGVEVDREGALRVIAPECQDGYHNVVAYLGDMETTTGQDHATAQFIATACNAHSDLVASLAEMKQMLAWFVKNAPDDYRIDFLRVMEFDARMARADAALDKARGGV